MTDKRMKKLMKRRTEKKKEAAHARQGVFAPRLILQQARQYPLENCWVQKDWQEGGLAVVVVARRQPNGRITFGNYLVDYYCLGLKNTYCKVDIPPSEFQGHYMAQFYKQTGSPIVIAPALAHELIYGAIEYAARWGFKPQRNFRDSQYVLDLPDVHPRSGQVEFGHEGKPYFIAGPYDHSETIFRQLQRTAGDGNFHFLMLLGEPPPPDFFADTSHGRTG